MKKITIDPNAGFCFGVVRAIRHAEEALSEPGGLSCLGDIVHNEEEISRLQQKGLQTISREDFYQLKSKKVLIPAHGEPPERYRFARENRIRLIDATCPIVLQLQQKIREQWEGIRDRRGQIVIFGKKNHAEITGLNGQIVNKGIIVEQSSDLEQIDFFKPIRFFSQTTKSLERFRELAGLISERAQQAGNKDVVIYHTVCRLVSKRSEHLAVFARQHDAVIFVSGKKSSNGQYLFEICKQNNPRSHFVSTPKELKASWFRGVRSIGITGATSTPQWLMQQTADKIRELPD